MFDQLNSLASQSVIHATDLAERTHPLVQLVRITLQSAQREEGLVGDEGLDRLTVLAVQADQRVQELVSELRRYIRPDEIE